MGTIRRRRYKRVRKKLRQLQSTISEAEQVNLLLTDIHQGVQKNIVRINKQVTEVRKWFLKYEEPYCEISQNHRSFFINMKLPDVHKKDITLKIENNKVEVKGIRKQREKKKVKLAGFYRVIEIPKNTKQEKARAIFKNNALKIRIPKYQV